MLLGNPCLYGGGSSSYLFPFFATSSGLSGCGPPHVLWYMPPPTLGQVLARAWSSDNLSPIRQLQSHIMLAITDHLRDTSFLKEHNPSMNSWFEHTHKYTDVRI